LSKVVEKKIRRSGFQFLGRGNARANSNREDMVFVCGANILRGVSDQSDRGAVFDQTFTPGPLDRDTREIAASWTHFTEGPESEKTIESRAAELSPSDTRQVACDQREGRARVRQFLKNIRDAGTCATSQVGSDAFVDLLRALDDAGHERCGATCFNAGPLQHEIQDVGIKHAVDRNSIRGGFNSRHIAHSFNERLPVVRAGAANQGAIDIEQNE